MNEIDQSLSDDLPEVIRIRRDLHAHPQLGYEETYASQVVQNRLIEWGIPFVNGLAGTGVVGWIDPPHAKAGEPAIGLRADLDALPIQEETGLPYASEFPGRMHACGHDGHTALLLGAARILWRMRSKLPQPIKLVFQPAEEFGAGAQRMTEAGALSERVGGRRVRTMFGLHGSPLLPVGAYATKTGALLAGCADVEIIVRGKGGHAALPHLTCDPIVAAANLITAIQTVVSRNCDPVHNAVVSICGIRGGEATNVIPESVKLIGTIRTHESAIFEQVKTRLSDLADGVARAYGCRAEVAFTPSYPAVLNDAGATEYAFSIAESVCGADRVFRMDRPVMASEDFAFYGRVVPSTFAFFGLIPAGRDSHPMLHTPRFDFTDAALEFGIRLMCGYALHADEYRLN